MSARLLTLMILIAVFAAILELVRREKLTFRYAFAWLLVVGRDWRCPGRPFV